MEAVQDVCTHHFQAESFLRTPSDSTLSAMERWTQSLSCAPKAALATARSSMERPHAGEAPLKVFASLQSLRVMSSASEAIEISEATAAPSYLWTIPSSSNLNTGFFRGGLNLLMKRHFCGPSGRVSHRSRSSACLQRFSSLLLSLHLSSDCGCVCVCVCLLLLQSQHDVWNPSASEAISRQRSTASSEHQPDWP